MSCRRSKNQLTDRQISAHELHIPNIAARAFNNAYKLTIAPGAKVFAVEDGHLLAVSKTEKVALRKLANFGSLKSGTRLKINKYRLNKDANPS